MVKNNNLSEFNTISGKLKNIKSNEQKENKRANSIKDSKIVLKMLKKIQQMHYQMLLAEHLILLRLDLINREMP